MFSSYNEIKLQINNRNKEIWAIHKHGNKAIHSLKTKWSNKKSQREQNYFDMNKQEDITKICEKQVKQFSEGNL